MLKVDNNMKQTNESILKNFAIAFLMWVSFIMIYLLITNL